MSSRNDGGVRRRQCICMVLMMATLLMCNICGAGAFSATARVGLECSRGSACSGSEAVELRYAEYEAMGSSAAAHEHEPVIVLHGLLGSKRNFATLCSGLSKQLQKRRKIVTVDLRNHGDNHHDWREEMSYTDMACDVLSFMDRQSFQKAVLVGHSMGGKVAKSLALMQPHRVAGLVVLDIAPVRYTAQHESWNAVSSIIQAISQVQLTPGKTKRDVDSDLRHAVSDPALRAFVLTNLEQIRSDNSLRWKININAILAQLDTIAGFDIHHNDVTSADSAKNDQLPKYEGDTFIIHGGASRFVRHAHMATIADYFPNHMLTTIRGAGHWVHAEAPDDTLVLLKQYLDR
uniref:AB hydrolase-1 domain-containing protein n=1 Tax=Helicotheca tamesis TaxID=374047 RepID=A0A7S2H8H6_9STRA